MGEADRLRDLLEDLHEARQISSDLRPVPQLVDQGAAANELHRQEGRTIGQRPQRVHGWDARVWQPGGDFRFGHEPVGVGARQQHFDGDVAIEDHLPRRQYSSHAAASDFAIHGITGNDWQVSSDVADRRHGKRAGLVRRGKIERVGRRALQRQVRCALPQAGRFV